MLIDSHCHLNYPGVAEQQADVLTRARAAGVAGMLNISTRESEWAAVIATAEREADVWAAVGIHPHEADHHSHVDADHLIATAVHPRVVALGETGLDFHYDHSDRQAQADSFRQHIAAARATGLPIIVHSRDAEDATVELLADELGKGAFRAVIHCFTGSAAFADAVLALGCYVSLAGVVTFKNAKALQAVAARLPSDRLLVETDAPFLAPVPHRGRPGEPAFVADTARFLADLRGETMEQVIAATGANFARLFERTRCA